LNPQEKARLIEMLYASYDVQECKNIDEAWAKEAENRLSAFEAGKMKGIPAEDVFEKIFG